MKGIIYKYTSPDGKSYIGQTINETKRRSRWRSINNTYGGTKIDEARNYWGCENFTYTVLEKYEFENNEDAKKKLDEREQFYINKYNTMYDGYNCVIASNVGSLGYKWTDEQKEKLKGENNSFYGKKHSEEAIKSISKGHKKPILQYSLEGDFLKEWTSIIDAESELKISNITNSIFYNDNTHSAGNYLWRKKLNDNYPLKIERYVEGRKKPILQYSLEGDFIKEYDSISAAAEEYNIFRTAITDCCQGVIYFAYGYQWKYKERNDFPLKINNISKPHILQYSLNGDFLKEWDTKKEILNYYLFDKSCLNRAIKGESKRCGFFQWRIKESEDYPKKIDKYIRGNKKIH